MEKREPKRAIRKYPYRSAEIGNPDLNYCPNRRNVLLDKRIFGRTWL